jgi:hypothetical protein
MCKTLILSSSNKIGDAASQHASAAEVQQQPMRNRWRLSQQTKGEMQRCAGAKGNWCMSMTMPLCAINHAGCSMQFASKHITVSSYLCLLMGSFEKLQLCKQQPGLLPASTCSVAVQYRQHMSQPLRALADSDKVGEYRCHNQPHFNMQCK